MRNCVSRRMDKHRHWYLFPERSSGPRLYAILFEDGSIKFCSTENARTRALTYSYDGTASPMVRFHVFGPLGGVHQYNLERRVIYMLAEVGQRIGKTEYFNGLEFSTVLRIARSAINAGLPTQTKPSLTKQPTIG